MVIHNLRLGWRVKAGCTVNVPLGLMARLSVERARLNFGRLDLNISRPIRTFFFQVLGYGRQRNPTVLREINPRFGIVEPVFYCPDPNFVDTRRGVKVEAYTGKKIALKITTRGSH